METTTDTKNTPPFDRVNSQIQSTVFQNIHHHLLCIFASDEKESECCTHENLHDHP